MHNFKSLSACGEAFSYGSHFETVLLNSSLLFFIFFQCVENVLLHIHRMALDVSTDRM